MTAASQNSAAASPIDAPPLPTGAHFIATQFILGSFSTSLYNVFGFATSFLPNANVTLDGQTYPDAFGVRANFGNNDLRDLDFLGTDFTEDATGAITGGTIEPHDAPVQLASRGISVSAAPFL